MQNSVLDKFKAKEPGAGSFEEKLAKYTKVRTAADDNTDCSLESRGESIMVPRGGARHPGSQLGVSASVTTRALAYGSLAYGTLAYDCKNIGF